MMISNAYVGCPVYYVGNYNKVLTIATISGDIIECRDEEGLLYTYNISELELIDA